MSQQNWVLARNIIIYDELNKVLSALNSAGINSIVLAGAALAKTVYPDIGLRPMSDIDLLVHQIDLPIIDKVLSQIGYLMETDRKDETHYHNTNPDFTMHIDVHTGLPYLDKSGLTEIWSKASRINLAAPTDRLSSQTSIEMMILPPEHALIYAATDALMYHGRLSQTCLTDIKFIIHNTAILFNWPDVIGLVKRYHLESHLYYALSVANQKIKTGIPEWVLTAIKPQGKKLLELRLYQTIFKNGSFSNGDLAPVLRFMTRPERFQVLLGSFFPSPDFMVKRYELTDRKLLSFYYPFRVLAHFGRVMKLIGQIIS